MCDMPQNHLAWPPLLRDPRDFENDTEKEGFDRRILLSLDRNAEDNLLQARVQTVVRNMSSYLWKLLSETLHDSIRTSMERVAQKAADFWLPIQRAQQKYETGP
ncbi:hypothetical protein NUU61_007912 [Penicillium alfredii]|uniref:Uncharacterized protein n=1 Tax=Penicillium alfredii TaxID=1506179 RepID=A0A9W9ERM5_9EURO|nr:uncharacterized protein NUU61_007912 [Penicillium alfredii]KAJ5086605.1 hypothetical protein NUU61_007912 [Penicillium alfredii]